MTSTSRWPSADQMLGRRAGAADVVDLDRAVPRQRVGVDHDDRHARPPDLLDLWMVVAQPDGHHAVHGRPAHRPGQAAVQRRDEIQGVARFLGRDRNPFAERAEERVGEDDRQRLRREHADRQRLALAEHPRDGMRRVAELVGHLADALGGVRRQPIRAVERERHGRLGHAGLAGDVGDARPDGPLLHSISVQVDRRRGPAARPRRRAAPHDPSAWWRPRCEEVSGAAGWCKPV